MNKKLSKGITLIALVITIIVLLILAGVTIGILTGENGLLNKSQTAEEETIKQTATETMNLKITNIQISSYAENEKLPDLQYLADKLCEDSDMEYVLLESKTTASLDKIEVPEGNSIYTKLKDYDYEFEINSSLQLASIDGVKVADNNTDENSTIISSRFNLNEANCIYKNVVKIDSAKSIEYTSDTTGPLIVIISGGSRNYDQTISIGCDSTAEITLVDEYQNNWGNSDGRGWTCVKTSIYCIPNVKVGDTITATGAAYTGFPIFMLQIIKLS